jgi:hypothetical protein
MPRFIFYLQCDLFLAGALGRWGDTGFIGLQPKRSYNIKFKDRSGERRFFHSGGFGFGQEREQL